MAILAVSEHGQDARGTESSRAAKNRGISNTEENRRMLRATGCQGARTPLVIR